MQLTVWRFLDGNRAHEKQSAALIEGLRRSFAGKLQAFDIPPEYSASRIVFKPGKWLESLPTPDFLIGTGRRSRLPMLSARYRFGGRAVAINRPLWPYRWFDFAIVPEHDRPPPLPNVIVSQGALTEPLQEGALQAGKGLILLGGPSKHYSWNSDSIREQVDKLLAQPLDWCISDSRRTPEGTMVELGRGRAKLVDWLSCPAGWLQEQLSQAERIWVTEDSISMLFESLQSRAQIGVIRVPSRSQSNKVRSAVLRLLDQGLVSERFEVKEGAGRDPLNQYLLCAQALLRRSGLPSR
ncbi:ELM1/GtrOC1 family putative glycosyltransferase [Microbulbifer sp. JMSA004]|uniref:ELM1/GtrOC1 family putative glycosyltransferase n=1 Tax=unclassified Microbulbifer TaxID=2619833 RepID=UPI0024AE5ABB|nr:ELM1/GtrOC1 family putative glycosyltransferase [Microbulbifer sp. VAAF005]WHI45302.1 ELM1/GtrOC1 family putative glycosyltransferase [Microbulbifer sp. VAAF005]